MVDRSHAARRVGVALAAAGRPSQATLLCRIVLEYSGQTSLAKRVIMRWRSANGVPGVAHDTMK